MNIFDALHLINEKLNKIPKLKWAVVGSMATAIQGCNIIPGDIDIWISRKIDVEKAVNYFDDYIPEDSAVRTMNDDWLSSKKQPVVTFQIGDTSWTFGRFYMKHIKIEIAHAMPHKIMSYVPGTGIWENGPDISNFIKVVHTDGHSIPVVPLEVQLQTNFSRDKEKRILEITKVFKTEGYDKKLLKYCLDHKNHQKFLKLYS